MYTKEINGITFKILEDIYLYVGIKKPQKRLGHIVQCPFCNKLFEVSKYNLNKGSARSCGCFRKDGISKRFTTHGFASHPLYHTIKCGIGRCTKPSMHMYESYGGRGIQWKLGGLEESIRYLETLEHALEEGYQMDRIDTNGNYEIGNIRFITRIQNMNNTRANINLTYDGKTQSIAMWSRELGISHATITNRYRLGLTLRQVFGIDPIIKVRSKFAKIEDTVNGELLTLSNIANKYSISQATVVYRYSQGIRGNNLLKPLQKKSLDKTI